MRTADVPHHRLEEGWFERLAAGERRVLARVLTLVENRQLPRRDWATEVAPRLGRAFIVGITGWPGVGKSTLTAALIGRLREQDLRVAVLAVDPTSDRSGGAVLGDRVRMLAHGEDPGVFIRSLASRGSRGGLAACALEAADMLDVAGFDVVVIETVGAGQTQTEILDLADAVVLVTAPGLGDDIQAIKGGILEIPDIVVVNQADRPGAQRMKTSLRALLRGPRPVEVLTTTATEGTGVAELWDRLARRRQETSAREREEKRTQRHGRRIRTLLESLWQETLRATIARDAGGQRLAAPLGEDPQGVAAALLTAACRRWLNDQGGNPDDH